MADVSSPEFIALVNRSVPQLPHDAHLEVVSVAVAPDQLSAMVQVRVGSREGSIEPWDVSVPFDPENFALTDQALAATLFANVQEWAILRHHVPGIAAQGRRQAP